MRLIDADELIETLKSYAECDWNKSLCMMLPNVVDDCIEFVDEQQTAYYIDKVVEKLEELADNSNDHMYESYFDGKEDGIREAIEIVKQGGVADDVCEWKREDEEANLYLTGCQQRQLIFEGTPKENGYRYCHYCGKKIKVVE